MAAERVGGECGKPGGSSSRAECSILNGRCGTDEVGSGSSGSSNGSGGGSNNHTHQQQHLSLDGVWLSRNSSSNCSNGNNNTGSNNNHAAHSSYDFPPQVAPTSLNGPSHSTASFPSKKRVLGSRSSGLAYKKLRLDQRQNHSNHHTNNNYHHHNNYHRRSESPSSPESPLLQLLQLSISSPDLFDESPQDALPKQQTTLPSGNCSVAATAAATENVMTREVENGSDLEVVYAGHVTGACVKDKKQQRRPNVGRSHHHVTSSKERMTVLHEDCSSGGSGANCESNGGSSRPPLQKSPRCQLFPSSCHERERVTLLASPCPSNRSSSGSTLDVDLDRVGGVGFVRGRKRWPPVSRRSQGSHSKRTSSSPAASSARHIPSRNTTPPSGSRGRWRLSTEMLDGEEPVSDWVSSRRLLPSPDPVAQVQQLEEDEEMARRLQAQFDAEASLAPVMSVSEPTTPRRARLPNSSQRRVPRTFRSVTQGMAPHMVGRRTSPVSRRPPQPPRWNFPHDDWLFVEPDFMRGSPLQLLVDFFEDGGVWQDVNMDEMFDELEAESPRRRLTRGRMARGRRRRGDWFNTIPWETVGDDYEALWDLTEQLGTATRQGLTRTQIGRLPTRTHTGAESRSFGTQCHICMCNYEINEQLRILPCCHDFHAPCIDRWLQVKGTCPVCRANVLQDQE